MKHSITALCLSALFASVSISSWAEDQSSYFISEELFTYIHSGPSSQYRIIGSVTSATPVEKLATSDDGEFIQIRDDKGREGWVRSETLAQGTTRDEKIAHLQQQVEQLTSDAQLEQQDKQKHRQTLSKLESTVAEQQEQLAQVTRERDLIQQKLAGYQDEIKLKWLLNGGVVAGGGVLLGLIVSFLGGKRKRRDSWM